MRAYVFRRLLHGIPIVLGVTLATFLLFHVFGGDPVVAFLGKHASPRDIDAFHHEYGFDRPLYMQYLRSLGQVVTLDFGRSFVTREPVLDMLLSRAGPSLSLTAPALLMTTVLAVSLSLLSALVRGGALDRALLILTVLGMSVSFLVYIVVGQYLFAFHWRLFHIHGYQGGLVERWPYLALPILILIIIGVSYDARFYRSVILEEIDRDYVMTARAKGASRARVLFVHVLGNAMVPVVTRVMISVPFLVTGSLLLESFFGIPGLGNMLLDAIDHADFPVIKAYTLLVSILFVLTNILTDIFYAVADPRVRLS